MINFKKGPAYSLRQVNYLAKSVLTEGIVAGMVVRLQDDGSGVISARKGAAASPAVSTALYGFAISGQDAGDVIESGIVPVFALDGHSVVQTDQVSGTISSSSYPLGAALSVGTDGLVKPAITNDKVIGWVESIGVIPGRVQSVTDSNGIVRKVQGTVTVLGIKLNS